MPVTYLPIATTTLSTNQASVSFTGIAGTYTDLYLVCFYRDTRTQSYSYPAIRFNGDSGSNYSSLSFYGTASTLANQNANNQTSLTIGEAAGASSPSGEYSPLLINIMGYTIGINKTVLIRSGNVNGNGGNNNGALVRQWRNTAAITQIDILPDGGGGTNIAAGSIFTLFGIKAA